MSVTIWHQDDLAEIPITKELLPIDRKRLDRSRHSKISSDHILIYHSDRFSDMNSLKILQQFNLDFDREIVKLNGVVCKTRLSFFKCLIPYFKDEDNFNRVLFLTQQTPFAYVLEDLYRILKRYRLDYLVLDAGKPSEINVTKASQHRDLRVSVNKEMNLVDPVDCDLIMNVVEINIVLESLKDELIYVYLNFKYPFML